MKRRLAQVGGWLLPFFESSAVGLIAAIADANRSSPSPIEDLAFVVCVVFLGARHAGRAWVCWAPLGASAFLVHLASIDPSYHPPYTEWDAIAGRACSTSFASVAFLLVVGVLLRAGLAKYGWFPPRHGSHVRVVPRTPRGWLAHIAGFAVLITVTNWEGVNRKRVSMERESVHAPGFDQGRFDRIGIGTPAVEVEKALGPPLSKDPDDGDGVEVWLYTRQANPTSDYWRRWIVFKDGRVDYLMNDYWYD